MAQTRIRRANSYGAAQSTAPFAVPGALSSSYQPARLGRGLELTDIGASFTPTHDRGVDFDERDEEDEEDEEDTNDTTTTEDDDSNSSHQHQHQHLKRRKSVGDSLNAAAPELSRAQKQGCFTYIKRRHSIAMAFASNDPLLQDEAASTSTFATGSNWEFTKSKHGVALFRSKRSRCEVRAVTRVNSSVKHVMALLAASESSASFARAQKVLLGSAQVLEARVLAQCVPASTSRYFHCGLKHLALKNPFGLAAPLDLVFLDYTDVAPTPNGKLVGFRILESIRVPEFQAAGAPKYVRASLRCEVYVVRETDEPGVVEVTFASHLDPKSKHASSRRPHWLEQAGTRLRNLRTYAENASLTHRLLLDKRHVHFGDDGTSSHCSVCAAGFAFLLRKRHSCRLCGDVACGRCSRKLPILTDAVTTRVRVCLRCILDSRHAPDELGRSQFGADHSRRGSVGNNTFIVYDEVDHAELGEQHVYNE